MKLAALVVFFLSVLALSALHGMAVLAATPSSEAPAGGTVPSPPRYLPIISNAAPPAPIVATHLTSGSNHNCARRQEGNVLCWGNNTYGELGLGNIDNQSLPMQIVELNGIVSVTAGYERTCAVRAPAGELYCWGYNADRLIADDAELIKTRPVLISGLGGKVLQVAVGARMTCVLLEGGAVKCWGVSTLYEDGVGTEYIDSIPREVEGLEGGATAISMLFNHACALMLDRTVRCWGNNGDGQLGNQSQVDSRDAEQVEGLTDIVQISAGEAFTCARSSSGAAYCWGRNNFGQLGDGTIEPLRTVPAPPLPLPPVLDIETGAQHACAVLTSGAMYCWGNNSLGQLGNGTTISTRVPTPVAGIADALQASAGWTHSCAITASTAVYCWGRNDEGALGTGNFESSYVPVRVVGLGG